jgi:alpha-ketoglutaric semialdehyde dehydrogenase
MNPSEGFRTFNPRENKFNDKVHFCSDEQELEDALQSAHEAFDFYSSIDLESRVEFLHSIKINLIKHKDEIKIAYCSESGLNNFRFEIEFTRTINQIQLFCDFLRNDFNEITSSQIENTKLKSPKLTKKIIPIGPILVIGSSNFPLAYSTMGGDSVSALAAGCPVIVKAHPMHVETSKLVAECVFESIDEMKFPKGVFSHLIDDSYAVATKLITDPRIKGAGFTGSIRGGRSLMDLAASRPEPIPVFTEMGSTNPVIVLKESLSENCELWSSNLAQAICNDAGQFCTKPGVIFIPNNESGIRFSKLIEEKVINNESFFMLHPNILTAFEELKRERAKVTKAELIEKIGFLESLQGRQTLLKTDIQTALCNPILLEEVFGPFAMIVFYDHENKLEECLSSIHGQLTITFLASKSEIQNNKELIKIASKKAGRIIFNGVPTGVTVCSAMHHGGPYPSSSDSRFTAVGTDSIKRFLRTVTYQNFFD